MSEKGIREGLLDILAKETDCQYLSELRMAMRFPTLARALEQIEPGQYTIYEWKDAIQYVTGNPAKVDSEAEAKDTFLAFLKQI